MPRCVYSCLSGRFSSGMTPTLVSVVSAPVCDPTSVEWGPLPHTPCSMCYQLSIRLCLSHSAVTLSSQLKFAVNLSRPGLLLLFSLEGFLLLFQFPPFLWVCLGCWCFGLILVDWLNLDMYPFLVIVLIFPCVNFGHLSLSLVGTRACQSCLSSRTSSYSPYFCVCCFLYFNSMSFCSTLIVHCHRLWRYRLSFLNC